MKVPVWIGNFVLMGYGTGAIMAVPAHDERDFEFCRMYGIPVTPVVRPADGELADSASMTAPFTEYGVTENSGKWSGLPTAEARRQMAAFAQENGFGSPSITFRIKDWGISRQRYWGYPDTHDPLHWLRIVPVPEPDLPVVLPLDVTITGKGKSPLEAVDSFMNVQCPLVRRPGPARKRHHGHVRGFLVVFLSLLRSAQQHRAF